MQTAIPCVIYRGGTSKGPCFLLENLPAPGPTRDAVLLAAMGSPHPRQIDGMGGAESLTSKVVIVSSSSRDDADVDYLFAQVNPNSDVVDYSSNCGNMISTVGPFAIEQGLVSVTGTEQTVRIYNVNTDSVIEAIVRTPNGKVTYEGDARIDGVPGTSAPVKLNFSKTLGSTTGSLFPTGAVREEIEGIAVTCIDVAVPTMIVTAQSLGIDGTSPKAVLDKDAALIAKLESMRREAGRRMGLGDVSQLVIPKPLVVSAPQNGGTVTSRDFVPYNCHATHSVTGAMSLSTACGIDGTVAADVASLTKEQPRVVVIEHPSGTIEVIQRIDDRGLQSTLVEASILRTCRKLMSGSIEIPSSVWTHADTGE